MLQEVKLLLTVQYAVKHANIGILQQLINPLIIFFFNTLQYNYSQKMLFYQWNLILVNSPKLQYAILFSGLVNWLRAPNKHKAINLRLEHLNKSCKIKIKYYKNSTYNTNIIFNQVCLLNMTVKMLYSKIEYIFSEEMLGAYIQVKADLNMFTLA